MPLHPAERLATNFTAYELGADKPEATDAIVANLRRVAAYLQIVRGILGVPLIMGRRSGFRTPAENTGLLGVGGSSTSSHLTGEAGDFVPGSATPGAARLSLWRAYHLLADARLSGKLPAFDQIIYYVSDGHIHIGLGSRMRGEIRMKVGEKYPLMTNELIDRLPGAVKSVIGTIASAISSVGLVPLLAVMFLIFLVLR